MTDEMLALAEAFTQWAKAEGLLPTATEEEIKLLSKAYMAGALHIFRLATGGASGG